MERRTFVKRTLALTALSAAPWRLRAAGHEDKPVIALFGATARVRGGRSFARVCNGATPSRVSPALPQNSAWSMKT